MKHILSLSFFIFVLGCTASQYAIPDQGTLPAVLPDDSISANELYATLVEDYEQGELYERTKIDYLINATKKASYRFVRNGIAYDARTTAEHLERKYNTNRDIIKTARDYIDQIATYSSTSGKDYLVLDKTGNAYFTSDLLNYELNRLEAFMDDQHAQATE